MSGPFAFKIMTGGPLYCKKKKKKMIQAAKIIGTGLATTGLIGAVAGIGVVFGALILGVARNLSLRDQLFSYANLSSLSCFFSSPPKPSGFVVNSLQASTSEFFQLVLNVVSDPQVQEAINAVTDLIEEYTYHNDYHSAAQDANDTIEEMKALDNLKECSAEIREQAERHPIVKSLPNYPLEK